MLGVESKPNDTDRFKQDNHEKVWADRGLPSSLHGSFHSALENLGFRGVFGGGLAGSFGGLSASLGAALSMSSDRGGVGGGGVGLRDSSVTSGVGVVPDIRGGREKESGLELVKPSLVLDIASLILYGCQALPIRLKILLDRLFSVLTHEDVLQVLHGFGWTYEDYARGYKLQDRQGNVLHSWHMMSTEEETLVLRQFLRFGETRAIAQQLLHHDGTSPPRPDGHAAAPTLRDSHRDPHRDRDVHRDPLRDIQREAHRDLHRDALRDVHRDSHRDLRDMRDRDPLREVRDFRDELRREENRREDPPRSQHQPQYPPHHHHQPQPQHQPDGSKNMDSDLKKFLERTNMLFSPFMRGDTSSLLRPPPPSGPPGLPPAPPPLSAASLASNLLAAANPSLATSILANPQLASSALSMLRLPVPPVSLPNISPNGSLHNSFGSPTSPMGGSPLNRLQSMQPYDIRKERQSPSPASRGEPSLVHGGRGGGVTSPASSVGGAQVNVGSGSVTPLAATPAQPPPHTPVSVNSDPPTDYTSEDDDTAFSASTTALNLSTTSTTVATSATPTTLPMPPRPQSPVGSGPNTPGKRSWNPINMGTSLINPVTGKKRVQCNVCLKTFCDKGALKIHFSAVHLREMHKCTVEGCNMMFSSRRSRNRHSANPNPKLHTPHVRRKISPHDGRTCAAHPVVPPHLAAQNFQPPAGFPPLGAFPGQFGSINPLTGLPFIPPSAAATEDLHKQALELQRRTLEMQHAMGKTSLDLTMRGREEGGMWRGEYGGLHMPSAQCEEGMAVDKMHPDNAEMKKREDEYNANNSIDDEMDDDSMSVDTQSMKGEGTAPSPSTNKRKRKSQNPTKFAFRLEDDDLISTDDDDDDDNDDDLDDIDTKDSEDDKNEDKELDAMSDDDDDTDNAMKESSSMNSGDKSRNEKDSDSSNRKVSSSSYDESVDTSNALRHLEDLSKGHFAHLTGAMPPNASASLGLQMTPSGNGVTSSSPRPSDRDSDRDSNPGSPSEDSDGAFQFGEGGFLSSLDIPMDKENPRRCVACGKMFQNHFGVKTHYQNVHLKLMHKCTVEGCNAAFPSKRSRDRHASNLNLHRKLLSTSSDGPGFPAMTFPGLPFNPALNPELLARLYSDPGTLPLGLDALKAHIPTSLAESLFNGDRVTGSGGGSNGGGGGGGGLPPATHPPPHFFLPNLLPHFTANNNLPGTERKDRSSTPSPQSTTPTTTTTTTPGPPHVEASSSPPMEAADPPTTTTSEDMEREWQYNLEDDLPTPDREGNMPCKFCHKTFVDGVGLKSHYDEVHSSELFRCTVDGCNKLFSARRKRNAHALNDALHQHLLEGAAAARTT
ncbi:zinc finger protein basonuclin-2-like isoform X1 [Panulirus ornatus]|uniref:zinc finger protein basonuclin-2-like isoform X1 n=1 Tax=Panulirus ornatus TaxID=150431 RepID=UPI003A867445